MPILPDTARGARELILRIFGSDNEDDTSSTQAKEKIEIKTVQIRKVTLFDELWENYPVNSTYTEAYTLVGGQALALHLENPDAYTNACALRFSRSVNYTGYNISRRDSSRGGAVKGGDGLTYLIRVKDAIKFVKNNFGEPTKTFKSNDHNMSEVRNKLTNKRGIIIFDVAGWGDASGHVTLWNGKTCGDHCYFTHDNPDIQTTEIFFWEID